MAGITRGRTRQIQLGHRYPIARLCFVGQAVSMTGAIGLLEEAMQLRLGCCPSEKNIRKIKEEKELVKGIKSTCRKTLVAF